LAKSKEKRHSLHVSFDTLLYSLVYLTTIDMPVVAGTVVWSRGLIERIKGPMDKLLALNRTLHILNLDHTEDKASQTVEFYHQLVRTIGEYTTFHFIA
jgi:Dynein heavy chain, N-terminal region 1